MILGLASLAALTLWMGRDFGFHFDEWTVLLEHYDGNYLTPLNGHLIVVPILVYQALLNTVGAGNFHAYLAVGVAVFIAIPATFYWVHRRLASPLLVAFLALVLAWSHASVPSLVFPFLINFDIPLLCLLWGLHATESDRLRDDGIAAGLVAIALASSGVGVTVAFAVIVDVAIRRPRPERLVLFVAAGRAVVVVVRVPARSRRFEHDPRTGHLQLASRRLDLRGHHPRVSGRRHPRRSRVCRRGGAGGRALAHLRSSSRRAGGNLCGLRGVLCLGPGRESPSSTVPERAGTGQWFPCLWP